jgi:hypothetical protein
LTHQTTICAALFVPSQLFFQNASTISFFSLNWSKFLVEGPFWLLSIVNFDVDFFKPDCLNTQDYIAWTYTHSLVLQLSLPLLVALYCIMLYLVSVLVVRSGERKARRAAPPPARPAGLGRSLSRSLSSLAVRVQSGAAHASRAGWRAVGVATTRQELADLYDDSVATFTSFLNVIYHTLTAKCLEVFMCNTFADGSQFLITSPTIQCWDRTHIAYIALAVIFFILYTIGIPLSFLLVRPPALDTYVCLTHYTSYNTISSGPPATSLFSSLQLTPPRPLICTDSHLRQDPQSVQVWHCHQ